MYSPLTSHISMQIPKAPIPKDAADLSKLLWVSGNILYNML